MLTPVFKIQQSEDHLQIEIYAPYADLEDAEIDFEGKEFFFTAKPYFLRLYLPAELGNLEDTKSAYDCDEGKLRNSFSIVSKISIFKSCLLEKYKTFSSYH